ncbi:hypothetical protein [Microcystis aeruginosa]|uniref:hypothetical protein n=1 Tax=Microcystis aeruginosa TaxID=1126 RepID=UPI001EFBB533|nr:hypothetical protein [Microcystis aeruginosa]
MPQIRKKIISDSNQLSVQLTEVKFRLCETGLKNSVFGRLVYATESCDPVRRWPRMLDRYCPEILRDGETLCQGLIIGDR